MASRKKTPDTSKLTRSGTVAYARKQKTQSEADADDTTEVKTGERVDVKAAQDASRGDTPRLGEGPKSATRNEPPVTVESETRDPAPAASEAKSTAHDDVPTEPVRARATTAAMPAIEPIGAPPEVPSPAPPAPAPPPPEVTFMPGPREIPDGNPTDPAAPPGLVPAGDSRSFRKGGEFALVYRVGTFVISRFGTVGQRGQWRVVEYPTSASASHSYAKECSRFVAEGFSDYRG